MSSYFTIKKYDEDHEDSPYIVLDAYGDQVCVLTKIENSDDMLEKLDRVYEAGYDKGRKRSQRDMQKALGIIEEEKSPL